MIIKYKSADHPEANGRKPQPGDLRWTLSFPLENGDDYLELEIGRKGREAILDMLNQENKDFPKGKT